MDDEWAAHAEIWESDDEARFFSEQALASLLEHVDLRGDDWERRRVLDFGCGTGLLTEKLAPLVGEVVAVDLSPAMLAVLRDKPLANVSVHCADLGDEAVRATAAWFSKFDLIVASSVCSFLPQYEATLGLFAQALNPDGFFVQWDWVSSGEDDDGLTLDSVVAAFSNAGLTCLHVDHAFDVPFGEDGSPVLIGVARKPRDR